jgi:nucleoside-diphosphate-sugar epimerase
VVIARIFNAYGPRETEPYVVPEIIAQLDRGDTIHLGNLKAQRDFTYVHDTARALMALMVADVPSGTAVNVGSGVAYSVEDIARRLAVVMEKPEARIVSEQRRLRRYDINLFRSDSTMLRQLTGWSPQVPLDDGLRRTVAWFRSHGHRWTWEDFVDETTMYR